MIEINLKKEEVTEKKIMAKKNEHLKQLKSE